MIDRVIEISETSASLSVRNGLLVAGLQGSKEVTVPLPEISVLLLSNPAITLTQPVLSGLLAAGGVAVFCDNKRLPVGMALPVAAHFAQTSRFSAQAAMSLPLKKSLWRQLIVSKIRHQAELLADVQGNDSGLMRLAASVKSGDPDNIEAQAARRYWGRVFGDSGFVRDRDGGGLNALLNYGYMVLRAVIARAVCSAGLHPSLGLHHHNQYDQYCLASDLMEPFRPLIDREVVELSRESGPDCELNPEKKKRLAGVVEKRIKVGRGKNSVFQAAYRLASSLAEAASGNKGKLDLPKSFRTG